MQNRLVAEIAALPASWRITFELKRTGESKICGRNFANDIFQVQGADYFPLRSLPDIKYSCKTRKSKIMPACKPPWPIGCMPPAGANYAAKIKIYHVINGRFFRREKRKELLLGEWSSFEISQAIEKYRNKSRLMFKVNFIEFMCKLMMYLLLMKKRLITQNILVKSIDTLSYK